MAHSRNVRLVNPDNSNLGAECIALPEINKKDNKII